MKLVNLFDDFLRDTVNLNDTRVRLLEDSIEAIKNVIKMSTWAPTVLRFAAQGSWAHKTIIKPRPDAAFDADLLVFVKPKDQWEAKDYINTLYEEFRKNDTYKDKVTRCSHCITIEYAGVRKIDIAPCVEDRKVQGTWGVCNRNTNAFEISSPEKYTEWLIEKNSTTQKNMLRKVTRLLKYLRDIKTTFTCPSFLFTTLLGMLVYDFDKGTNGFADVPTSLKTLMGRLDDWLQMRPSKPTVRNPVLFSEIQSDTWDEEKYQNFRSQIHRYRQWIDEAYDEEDREESLGKWRRVFGHEFAKQAVADKARSVSPSIIELHKNNPQAKGIDDLVGLVKQLGRSAIPEWFNRLPYMKRPTWRVCPQQPMQVVVKGYLAKSRNDNQIRATSSLQLVQPCHWIRFDACDSRGLPFSDAYKVMWRITNTDKVAESHNALRGDFYASDFQHTRWESLSYRGVHMAEAFLIRKADSVQVSKSDPYYVVIE